jgi:signal transduction histidine kinase
MTWRHHRRQFGGYRHGPVPRAVRRMGCIFAGLIVFAAIGATALVSLLLREPERVLPIAGISFLVLVALIGGFASAFRRMGTAFGEQTRLRRQLMADVAHELRTPVAILQGRIEGMLDGVYERDDARLGELLEETRHLGRLVADVGTIANAEAGALDLKKERIDLAELIRDAAASVPGTTAPVEVHLDQPLPPLTVDPLRIREVLLNLLSNALRHTPPGGVVAIHGSAQQRQVAIRVTDTGSGIAAEELPRIFERFHKGRDSRGSGLGLAISRDLVRAHGGDIRVESIVGRGTTVEVTLPL